MANKRNTDKYRKRMKHQHANSVAHKQREDFELQVWHRHLAEQRKAAQQAAKALENGRRDLLNHLSSLFWLRYYQQDPEKARGAYALMQMNQMLHAVTWRQGNAWMKVLIPSIDFGNGVSEPFEPKMFWDLYNS